MEKVENVLLETNEEVQAQSWTEIVTEDISLSVANALARDEELGYEYLGYETTIYPENCLFDLPLNK